MSTPTHISALGKVLSTYGKSLALVIALEQDLKKLPSSAPVSEMISLTSEIRDTIERGTQVARSRLRQACMSRDTPKDDHRPKSGG